MHRLALGTGTVDHGGRLSAVSRAATDGPGGDPGRFPGPAPLPASSRPAPTSSALVGHVLRWRHRNRPIRANLATRAGFCAATAPTPPRGGQLTANANLYRSGLAGQGLFPTLSRQKVTLIMGVIVIVASVFPFIYRNYLIFVTYAGITLVPIGGILFAEHYLLPRLGMTRFWARYKGVRNTPALLAWAITLALAAATVALGLVPVYFAFPPAFILSVALYVLLARMMGATEQYPEGEAADRLFQERVEIFHAEQAATAPTDVDTTDRRALTSVLRVVWIVDLVVIFATAVFVLLFSPDFATYTDQRNQFFWVAGAGTVIYFVAAYWRLRRTTSFARHAVAEHRDHATTGGPLQSAGGSHVQSA